MKWGRLHVAAAVLGISAPGVAASAQPAFAGLEGLYIIGCGHSIEPDGSVIIYAIPGHTPGQVLLVRLAKFDSVMLSGDAVRFRYNLEKRHIPSNNVDREQTLTSYQRIEQLLAQYKAQLWANHDKDQNAGLRKSPEYYE